MCKYLLLILATCVGLQAQTPLPPQQLLPPDLVNHLELTTDQVNAIARLNFQSGNYSVEKYRRSNQVQAEIAQETAKETLDPIALGLRYLELEAIRRDIKADQEKTVAEVQKLLTPAQKAKLAALDQALRQYSTACTAVSFNLMPMPTFVSVVTGAIGVRPSPFFGFTTYPTCDRAGSVFPANVIFPSPLP